MKKCRNKYTITEIAQWLKSDVAGEKTREVAYLLTDSRSLTNPDQSVFISIATNNNDGHKYIASLYERGVRAFIVERDALQYASRFAGASFVEVADSIDALQCIARHHRDELSSEVVAITGSRGKTTLKEWLFQLLEPAFKVERSPRSYNSQIGVPLSLWNVSCSSDVAIIEAGVSKVGEMQRLAECINPEVVILTNIGDAHAQGFKSDRQKAEEKVLLASSDNTKCVIYCADYTYFEDALKRLPNFGRLQFLTWSLQGNKADLQLRLKEKLHSMCYSYGNREGEIILPDILPIDVENAANALACMIQMGIDDRAIESAFLELHKIGTRLNVSEGIAGCHIIYDSYTSDFSSLPPALDFMRRRKAPEQQQVLILSDLRHESRDDRDVYEDVARLVKRSGVARMIGIGKKISAHKDLFDTDAEFYDDTATFLQKVNANDFANEIILLKGAPEFNFINIMEMLEARTHETVLEVNLDALVRNYNYFRGKLPAATGIVCMVKASGYGAGSREIAKTLQDCGAAYLAVAVLDEGIDLRKNGITMPIMVMNPRVVNYKIMFQYHLEPEIYSFSMLEDVIREAQRNNIKGYPIHIKLDTGMHRMGFIGEELPELMKILNSHDEVVAESVFSHLATADCEDMNDYTALQLSRFEEYSEYMLSNYPRRIKRHILNSAGILRFPDYHYDLVRLGIGLYGANTLPPEIEKPLSVVSTLRTVIIAIREWKAGETIGYGRKGKLLRDSKVATIPIGYADGMNRRFGNGALKVAVNGKLAPTIGNICMDACMIDVTDIDCEIGDSVEIFGRSVSVQTLADVLETIPYEVLTAISPRVKRVYYRE